MSKHPSIAIIIPVYNEEASIAKCLAGCINQTDAADEIIVVNNNSTDDTATIVKKFQRDYPKANIRLLNEKSQGIVPARNHGFDKAKSDVLGRIDADSYLEDAWVAAVRSAFSDVDVAASTGPVLYHDMPMQKVGLRVDEKIRNTLHRLAKDHRFLFGSNMAIRATAWHEVKGLVSQDASDELHEDIDLALTLYENDLEIIYDPTMVTGMSARRLEDSPRDFYKYVMRFERTFKAHGVKSASARIPIFIYLLIYFPIRTIRKFYDGDENQFTWSKLREDLKFHRNEK